jgi:hypothetical protein
MRLRLGWFITLTFLSVDEVSDLADKRSSLLSHSVNYQEKSFMKEVFESRNQYLAPNRIKLFSAKHPLACNRVECF